MSIKLNEKGYSHARSAADSGDTTDAPWDAPNGSARKENECLGVDTSEPEGSAARLKYPVFSGGKLNWNAVHAAESRATQNGASAVAEAAKKLAAMRKEKGRGMSAGPVGYFVMQLDGDDEGQLFPGGLAGWPTEADGVPIHYRTVTVAPIGSFKHRGTGEPIDIPLSRAKEWVKNTMALSAAGVEPFIPGQHRDKFHASDNYGYVKRVFIDNDNKLKAIMALYGDDARVAAARNGRSIYVVKDAMDDKGKVYPGESIAHIALVPNPALSNLGPTVKIAASADGATIIDVPVYEPSVSSPVRSHEMTPENAAKVRKAFGLGTDVPDNQLADKAAEKALALSAEVTAITAERNTLKAERETLNNRVLQLDASAKPLDPIVLSMFADNIAAKREMAVSSGAVTEAEMKGLDAILNDGEGKPSVLALSASGSDRKPLAFKLLDWVAKLSHNGLRTGNAVPRGATVAEPALTLSADGQPVQKEMTPERLKELLSQTNTGRAILADAAKK